MKKLSEIYGARFFAKRYKLHWRSPHVCKAIDDVLHPMSVVDVGCATGDLVLEWLQNFNIRSIGIEGDKSCLPHTITSNIYIHDLRTPIIGFFDEKEHFDLCTCFEVAEHIEPEYAHIFAKNLTELSDRILVSVAPPGQGGLYHVNCQPISYWQEMFTDLGYYYDPIITETIKMGLEPWRKKDGIKAFHMNLAYFEKEDENGESTED